jgi:hypothetical protein
VLTGPDPPLVPHESFWVSCNRFAVVSAPILDACGKCCDRLPYEGAPARAILSIEDKFDALLENDSE